MLFQNREGMERGNPLRSTVYRKGLFHLMNETINPGIISKPFFLDTLLHSIAKIVFSIIFFFFIHFFGLECVSWFGLQLSLFLFHFFKEAKRTSEKDGLAHEMTPLKSEGSDYFLFYFYFLIIILGYSMLYPFCVLWRVLYSILVFTY